MVITCWRIAQLCTGIAADSELLVFFTFAGFSAVFLFVEKYLFIYLFIIYLSTDPEHTLSKYITPISFITKAPRLTFLAAALLYSHTTRLIATSGAFLIMFVNGTDLS